MGRKRKDPALTWLPARVYPGKSAYEFHPKSGGAIRLGLLTDSKEKILKRWTEENNRLNKDDGNTFERLCDELMKSPQWIKLSLATRKDYTKSRNQVCKVIGKRPRDKIKPQHIRKYMDLRGKKAEVRANREHAFMSKVFQWGYERGMVTSNPCRGVAKFTETPRDRYITDIEYDLVYKHACLAVRIAMEISYLCAARCLDVLTIERGDITSEGILIEQGKTKKKQIKAWTPRLKKTVEAAKKLPGIPSARYLISTIKGNHYSYNSFRSRWTNAMGKARAEAKEREWPVLDFTFHDIKAKAISDFEGTTADKQEFSGHKTAAMVERYDRVTKVVRTLNKPERKD